MYVTCLMMTLVNCVLNLIVARKNVTLSHKVSKRIGKFHQKIQYIHLAKSDNETDLDGTFVQMYVLYLLMKLSNSF